MSVVTSARGRFQCWHFCICPPPAPKLLLQTALLCRSSALCQVVTSWNPPQLCHGHQGEQPLQELSGTTETSVTHRLKAGGSCTQRAGAGTCLLPLPSRAAPRSSAQEISSSQVEEDCSGSTLHPCQSPRPLRGPGTPSGPEAPTGQVNDTQNGQVSSSF